VVHPEPGTVCELIPADHPGDDDERKDWKNEPFLLIWETGMEYEKNCNWDENQQIFFPGPQETEEKH
jgi:hypothetical protein